MEDDKQPDEEEDITDEVPMNEESKEPEVVKAASVDAQRASIRVEEDHPSQVYTSSKATIEEKTKQQSNDTTIVKPVAKNDDQEVVIELH